MLRGSTCSSAEGVEDIYQVSISQSEQNRFICSKCYTVLGKAVRGKQQFPHSGCEFDSRIQPDSYVGKRKLVKSTPLKSPTKAKKKIKSSPTVKALARSAISPVAIVLVQMVSEKMV